jgi:hypothetical protein
VRGWAPHPGDTGPLPEAYNRVTDPERYRPLHTAADQLLGRLRAQYVVEVVDSDDLREGVERCVSVTPSRGAPLRVEFTAFPGLAVRYGRWCEESYPWCGCDACDEDPDDLVEEFESRVQSLVAGQFDEEVTRSGETGWLRSEFGRSGRGRRLEPGDPALAEPGRFQWPAWPRRH